MKHFTCLKCFRFFVKIDKTYIALNAYTKCTIKLTNKLRLIAQDENYYDRIREE